MPAIALEVTSFKVQLTGDICPLTMKLVFILLEILQPKPLGLGMLG